ncbi:D-glycerate dehydrogenase [Candidatus Uhrbacteria bacterium]|nr:D-glycerate dehydrogenase [Candidatus Uhrbacteria bacterium]
MSKIFVTRPIPDAGLNLLKENGHQVVVNKTKVAPSQAQIIKAIKGKGYDALLSVLTEKVDDIVMAAAGPQLKIIANFAVGFDNIDLAVAKKRGILVTNAPSDEISETVAEHTVALMLAMARRLVESDKFTRQGKYKAWDPFGFLGADLSGKVLGVVGLGRIGAAVVRRAVRGFNMKVMYYDVKPNTDFEKEYDITLSSLDQVLEDADFISVHVPLLPSTRHLIGSHQLALMKKTAYLINTSRGPVVDEKALVKALKSKAISGAGLDVYEFEPRLAPGLSKLPNTILTPHIASASLATRQVMSLTAAKNIIAALSGQTPPNLAK